MKTDIKHQVIKGLEEYDISDIRIMIAEYIDNALSFASENEFKYIDMELVGSRITGNNREDSDLDVVVYYSGSMREDDAFNTLNDDSDRLYIESIMVDINPKNEISHDII